MRKGCKAHYCYLTGYRDGMATNSICKCLTELPLDLRAAIEYRINILEKKIKQIKSDTGAD